MSKDSKAKRKLKQTLERNSKKLPTTPIREGLIHFRFDYFDGVHSFFDGSEADFGWTRKMIMRLKEFQKLTVRYFKTDTRFRTSQYVHRIKWDEVHLDSFNIQHASPDLEDDAWQFGLSKATGRVHGFFIGDFFYIVWIDPEHRLSPYWTPN